MRSVKPSARGASLLLAFAASLPAVADEALYISRGSSWKFLPGLGEASAPDPAAWRGKDFDDSGWEAGPAPFGYGDPPYGTDLARRTPPMRNSYSTLFLRRTFEVSDPGALIELQANVDYDDGFIAWLNGVEVLRVNVAGLPGDPVAFDGVAARDREPGRYENLVLSDPRSYLTPGRNVIAVVGFNSSRSNLDFKLDLELLDPLGPDLTPPVAEQVVPGPGATLRRLTRIEVTFSEDVAGVDAPDLRLNGRPAEAVSGSSRGPYRFTFLEPPPGPVEVSWSAGHGITDLSSHPNAFGGGSFGYTLDPAAPPASLAITELLAQNRGPLLDEDGEASDWIEVLNRGPAPLSLSGWSLSDERDDPGKWTFPGVSIAPGEHRIVFASGKDRRPVDGNPLHASFELSSAGEYLGLFTPEVPRQAVFEFAPRFPEQRTGISYGLDPAGQRGYHTSPSPGAPNGAATFFQGVAADPVFGPPHGFFTEPVAVEILTRTPQAAIRFTLDGSEPSAAAGLPYAGPISAAGSARKAVVTLRAVALREGYLPSNVTTSTYIFPDHVLTQPPNPDGFPTRWGPAPSVDYEVDPQVAQNPLYREAALEALRGLPSMSVVCSLDDLFGPRGLYSNSMGDGPAWEKPASAELVFPDGRRGFQANCGLRLQGGASREPPKSPKHSFRLAFRSDHGPSKLRFPFFPGSAVESFDAIHLRASFNNSWIHWSGAQRARAQYIHDQWAHDTQRAMGQLSPQGIYLHLYLNGLYWGLYNAVERPDASFAAAHLGGGEEDYDALNSAVSVDGDRTAWSALMGLAGSSLASEAPYQAVLKYLEAPALADYMLLNFYGANQDWPHHNWYAVRKRERGAGLLFVSWDAERILEDVGANRIAVSDPESPAFLHSRLTANAEYRLLFADRAHRHLVNGALTPAEARERWMARAAEIDRAVILESARWGDYRRDVHQWQEGPYEFYTRNAHWVAEQNRLLTQYFPRRGEVLLNQLRQARLYPRVGAPVFDRPEGAIEPGALIAIRVPEGSSGTIYYTSDGSDPRVYGSGAVSSRASTYGEPLRLADFTHLKARVLGEGRVWSALNEARYTVNPPAGALRITEIMYHPRGADLEFIEIENRGPVTIDLSGSRFREGIEFSFPEGAALGPGEFLVLVEDSGAFAARHPRAAFAGVYRGSLENGGERVTLEWASGGRLLSVEYDDAGFWPLAADGLGHSLVLADPDGDPGDPESWRASAVAEGSPGAEDPAPLHGGVVVSEVLARAAPPLEDAVELQNLSGRPVSIGGWYLSDSREDQESLRKFRIPEGTVIPAGGYAVFYERQWSAPPGSPESFSLHEEGGSVFLAAADAAGDLRGYLTGVSFGAAESGVSFGRHATGTGPAFTALSARTFGADSPASLEEFRSGAGAPNAPPLIGPVVLNEVHYHPAEGGWEFVELWNPSGAEVALHDPGLNEGWRVGGVLDEAGADLFEFPPSTVIPPRGFLLLAPIDPLTFRSRHSVAGSVPIAGPYGGALDNGGERIQLLRPDPTAGPGGPPILVDQVAYRPADPWPAGADGGGPSLERVSAAAHGGEPSSWRASSQRGGTPGAPNSSSPPPDDAPPLASFEAGPPAGPVPLTVSFDASRSSDPDGAVAIFEWSFGDGSSGTGMTARHTYLEPGTYAVVLRIADDLGASSTAVRHVTAQGPPPSGRQVPGDGNQDGKLDISDAIWLVGHLFLGWPAVLPCEGGTIADEGNRMLLEVNGQAGIDLADAVHLLGHLFNSGPGPLLGTDCVALAGCPDACGG